MPEAMRRIRRALRRPTLPLLQFVLVPVDRGLAQGPARVWSAADHKHAFTITCELNGTGLSPFFVAHVSWLNGSQRRKIGWNFKTFEDAVRLCSIYTRESRRQVTYHEAGHAVTAWLLGFSGVWVDMEDSAYRAVTRYDSLPPMLAVADGGRDALARYLYEELMFSVAGMVAEARIAGYPAAYVEKDVAGRTSIAWDAVRVAHIEAGLPICGHQDCEIPFDASPVDAGRIAEVLQRAEDEVFVMLKANWPAVERVVQALCKRDRLTTPELDTLIAGLDRTGPVQAEQVRVSVGAQNDL
jgi:hypothetical protein